jgi:hypothetical protein
MHPELLMRWTPRWTCDIVTEVPDNGRAIRVEGDLSQERENRLLTKSDLGCYRTCPRQLWLRRHRPDLAPPSDDPTTWRRAQDGNIVAAKAREQLPAGFLWPKGGATPEGAFREALALIEKSPAAAAAEVPLVREGLYARADALVPASRGYRLRETKASTFPLKDDKITPKAPKEHHLDDLAIQTWVYETSGLELDGAELNLLNGQWRYPGDGDYRGLFRQLDVTIEARARAQQVPAWLAEASAVLEGPMPAAVTGKQCEEPYPCPYTTFCEPLDPPAPESPIELLPGSAGKELAKKLRAQRGYTSILDPKPEEFAGNAAALYERMQRAHRTGEPILEPGSGDVLAALPYPRYYFDFEGIDLSVPRWTGVRPYEHIPFQWSCHIEERPGHFSHSEFLDLSGDDPSIPCIEHMLKVMPPTGVGPILVFHKTYEATRLKELAARHPGYATSIDRYLDRIVDLRPLVEAGYYHPAMRGSFSIKAILPTVAPDLDYGELDEVQHGTAAQVAYLYAALEPTTTPTRREALRRELLRYCRLDTWAMVEVAHFLERRPRPARSTDAAVPV